MRPIPNPGFLNVMRAHACTVTLLFTVLTATAMTFAAASRAATAVSPGSCAADDGYPAWCGAWCQDGGGRATGLSWCWLFPITGSPGHPPPACAPLDSARRDASTGDDTAAVFRADGASATAAPVTQARLLTRMRNQTAPLPSAAAFLHSRVGPEGPPDSSRAAVWLHHPVAARAPGGAMRTVAQIQSQPGSGITCPGWLLLIPRPGGRQQPVRGHHPRRRHKLPQPTRASPSARPHAPSRRPKPAASRHPARPPSRPLLPPAAIIELALAAAISTVLLTTRRRRRGRASVPNAAPAGPQRHPATSRGRHARRHHVNKVSARSDDDRVLTAPVRAEPSQTSPPGTRQPSSAHIGEDAAMRHDRIPAVTLGVGIRDSQEILLPLDDAGLALDGPGADSAARAIAVTLLARAAGTARVVIAGADAARLFPAIGPATAVPGLVTAADPGQALGMLEAELLRRQRMLDSPATGSSDPDELLPSIVLIAGDGYPAGRLAAVLALGGDLGISGIILGPPTHGGTACTVADGGLATATGMHASQLDGALLYQLSADDAGQMLTSLAEADPAPPTAPRPPPRPARRPPTGHADSPQPVYVAVLGPPALDAAGQPVTRGLRTKAYELLTYLACHPGGAATSEILDALWPDMTPQHAAVTAYTVVSNIRQVLRTTTGDTSAAFITHSRGRYSLNPTLITTDLQRFHYARTRAASACGDTARADALSEAAGLWRGDLADGHEAEWLEPLREQLRRDAADTFTQLATLREHDTPDHAIQLLEQATAIDRYQERLYQRMITLQAALGRPDAARRTFELLRSRLEEIDAEPAPATMQALHEAEKS
jgi:DNA-binding SARP family transcriptional activator